MKARISVLTLGVSDLEQAISFYRDGLGLATEGIVGTEYENGAVAFFQLQGGLQLALWPWTSLAADSGLPVAKGGPGMFTLSHNVNNRAEVDQVMDQAEKAGAVIVKSP